MIDCAMLTCSVAGLIT